MSKRPHKWHLTLQENVSYHQTAFYPDVVPINVVFCIGFCKQETGSVPATDTRREYDI